MRDDFVQSIKERLAARSGHKCNKPGCEAATSGPQAEENKAINIGVAAHISAAAKGGPRYDPNLSAVQRASIVNGIWLCQKCSVLIDRDPMRYSTALLYHWKLNAEHAAHEQIGKPKAAEVLNSDDKSVPSVTVRIVQDPKNSRWNMGSIGNDPIMFVHFYGHITEIAGKQTHMILAELPDPLKHADLVTIMNGHDGRRPQMLHPQETANISATFIIPPVNNLGQDGQWTSSVIFIDQFGNRHEIPNCVFRKLPG